MTFSAGDQHQTLTRELSIYSSRFNSAATLPVKLKLNFASFLKEYHRIEIDTKKLPRYRYAGAK
jgi:hypothetical protein